MQVPNIPENMQAATCRVYGTSDDISLQTIPVPSPGSDQVLVRVIAMGLNAADRYFLWGKPYMIRLANGILRPKKLVPGEDLAGVVVRVGSGCNRLKVGDRVFGQGGTGLAEYAAVSEAKMQVIPDEVSFTNAAALGISGTTALQANDAAGVTAGAHVLIHGASGGVGSTTTKIAAARKARVTATCSEKNVETVSTFGAGKVLDYARDTLLDSTSPYDAIIDCAGTLPMRDATAALTPGGKLVRVGFSKGEWIGPIAQIVAAPFTGIGAPGSVKILSGQTSLKSLAEIANFARDGVVEPHIEQIYALADIQSAFQRLESGRTVGKSVVQIAPDPA